MAKKKTATKKPAQKKSATKGVAKKKVAKKTANRAVKAKVNKAALQYVIFVLGDDDDEQETMYAAPLAAGDAAYLRDRVIPTMKPLSDEEYITGPAAVLQTLAHFSYVLFDGEIYWCVEWPPGLMVIRFSPQRGMAWTGLRSPIPNFGNRKPLPEDLKHPYDEDAENHQYNLVFTAWDAQFDKDDLRFGGFKPASKTVQEEYRAALAPIDALGDQLEAHYGDDESGAIAKKSLRNLKKWLGEGIRLK